MNHRRDRGHGRKVRRISNDVTLPYQPCTCCLKGDASKAIVVGSFVQEWLAAALKLILDCDADFAIDMANDIWPNIPKNSDSGHRIAYIRLCTSCAEDATTRFGFPLRIYSCERLGSGDFKGKPLDGINQPYEDDHFPMAI